MNNDDILSKYIEKVDKDQSDLRTDIRESEKRTANALENIEKRMDGGLNRIEDLIAKQSDDLDKKLSKQNDNLNKKISDPYSKLESKINESNKEFKVMNRQFLIFLIATFLSIAGILATAFYQIANLIQKLPKTP